MLIFSKTCGTEYYSYSVPKIAALIVYCWLGLASYYCCQQQFTASKEKKLQSYYQTILTHSLNKLDHLVKELPADRQDVKLYVEIDKLDVKICYLKTCTRYNSLEFSATIHKHVPHFIHYKIIINDQLLHCSNTETTSYGLEKTFNINDYNRLTIALSIDPIEWHRIKNTIIWPYLLVMICATLLLALFVMSSNLLARRTQKFYFLHYKNIHDAALAEITAGYNMALKNKENMLMKKIWNFKYSHEKEAELNYLFSQEVNKVVQNKLIFYNIPLYCSDKGQEKVNIENLIEVFVSRFAGSEDNVSINIASSTQVIEFVSRAALYQIIHSIINYIIFILQEQSRIFQYNVKLNITDNPGGLCLLFEYDGFQVSNEEDIFKFSNKFFKKSGNPFLLSLSQIFSILRADQFNCQLGYSDCNFINITKNFCIESEKFNRANKSGVVKLPVRKSFLKSKVSI